MDEFEVPGNVEVHKQPAPGNLSYPLQTKEVVTALDLGELEAKVSLFYMNNRPGPTLPHNQKKYRLEGWFNVFSLTWYGHSKENPHFFMGVHLCKPQYRKRINEIIREEVLPLLKRWMKDVARLPNINSLSFDYHRFFTDGKRELVWGLERRSPQVVQGHRPGQEGR